MKAWTDEMFSDIFEVHLRDVQATATLRLVGPDAMVGARMPAWSHQH